ncbi:hypothetical protein PIB30_053179 [Stylosanthes scabra]|uniref:CRIB domain-containing protein n=1 Tax=Stylosanthes scabra TaxID=79078 RepID=A0ABU6WLT2_9FABA|nr:hypothetical protein [Stylosanthes scabra]
MPNNCKVKGILKRISFISQVFESDKEKEIEIGHPTDVKHVAHIGWQGHSAENNPSWMNEFKSSPGLTSSAPLSLYGDLHSQGNDNSPQWDSQETDSAVKRGSRSMNGEERDARSSRKQSMRESHAKEKSDRPRNPKTRSSKSKESSCNNKNESTNNNSKCSSEQQQIQGCSSSEQPPRNNLLPDVSKRTSSIKVKDASSNAGSTATKSRSSRAQHHHHRDHNNLNREISSRSGHKARNKHSRHLEEDQSQSESEHDQDQNGHHLQRGSGKILLTN